MITPIPVIAKTEFLIMDNLIFPSSVHQLFCGNILGYEERRPFWHFFDWKAYLIMTCMMSGGIGFRAAGIFPEIFIAFFYSGLGLALALAGIIFIGNYLCYSQLIGREQD